MSEENEQEFEERLTELIDEFIDNEKLSESKIIKLMRADIKSRLPVRRKRLTDEEVVSKVLAMTDKEIGDLPEDKRKMVLDLRKELKKKVKP